MSAQLIAHAVTDEAARVRLVDGLFQLVDQNGFGGVYIDFEEVPAAEGLFGQGAFAFTLRRSSEAT